MASDPLRSQIECTVDLASDDQPLTKHQKKYQKRDKEKMRAYRRKSYAKNREKNLAQSRRWRAENQDKVLACRAADKAKAHAAFRQQFDAERERERQDHLQIKAAQLRRSIMRDGVIADHTITICDLTDMVTYVADHVPICDRGDDGGQAAIIGRKIVPPAERTKFRSI